MATRVTYVSDLSDEAVAEAELVTIEVQRVGVPVTTIHISDSELGDLMEESEALGALILHD